MLRMLRPRTSSQSRADQQPARQWGSEGTTCQTQGEGTRACPFHHRIYLDRYEDTVGGFLHFDGSERAYRTRAYVGDSLVATRGRYGQLELSYLLRDRLGSVVGVETVRLTGRTPTAIVAETRHGFDAWGAPRSNRTWTAAGWREESGVWLTPSRTQQGFTGHERLSGLQLIHMRGRVFDPQLGRFHGVDPIIQFPLSSQGLNPYGYILNNPMAGVDPTGYACEEVTGTRITQCGGALRKAMNIASTIISTVQSYGVFATSCGQIACGTSDNGANKQTNSHGVLRQDGAPAVVAERGPEPSGATRAWGAARIVGGGLEVGAAAYVCAQTLGAGCLLGGATLGTLGIDQIYTGAIELRTGLPRESQTVQLFQGLGADLGTARMLEFGINLGAAGVLSAPYVGWRARSALPSTSPASSRLSKNPHRSAP